jgi:hypothetical protein
VILASLEATACTSRRLSENALADQRRDAAANAAGGRKIATRQLFVTTPHHVGAGRRADTFRHQRCRRTRTEHAIRACEPLLIEVLTELEPPRAGEGRRT